MFVQTLLNFSAQTMSANLSSLGCLFAKKKKKKKKRKEEKRKEKLRKKKKETLQIHFYFFMTHCKDKKKVTSGIKAEASALNV